jgi:hypothetical protein
MTGAATGAEGATASVGGAGTTGTITCEEDSGGGVAAGAVIVTVAGAGTVTEVAVPVFVCANPPIGRTMRAKMLLATHLKRVFIRCPFFDQAWLSLPTI